MNSEKIVTCNSTWCDNCKYIENLILDAYNDNREYKNALNMIIDKNNIILEQNKIIENLKEELKNYKT